MKLSTRSRCGTKILIDIAANQIEGPVQTGHISRRQNISVKYLEQLIRPLKREKFVSSIRGPKGGYILAKKPEKITLGQIVRLFEGQNFLVECVNDPKVCFLSRECRIRLAWKRATQALWESLDSTSIADLVGEKCP